MPARRHRPDTSSTRQWSLLGVVALGALAALGLEARAVSRDLETPRDLHRVAFVGSAACTRCHAEHAASFERTFHRTMTREATREAVLAPFAGETLSYGGFLARMLTERGGGAERDGAGLERFVIELTRSGEIVDRAVVSRTVGSHRDQQFLAREEDRWVRLPVAWDVEDGRWIHMNEAFLTPDPAGLEEGTVTLTDYARHVVPWNDNCVFCHNVGPRPGLDPASGRFATEVAELGVACEACHGPGSEHVRLNASPLRRYALHGGGLADRADPTIVSPARLSAERSSEVCGRCHGQRITDDVSRFLREGDPFVPGEELSRYSTPLFADTTLRGEPGVFAPRFWDDGTARLTAYEYQGLIQSRCATEGGLGCNDCHAMHEGDPRGQLRPSAAGDAMCTRCHGELAPERARLAHVQPPASTHAVASLEGPAHARTACVDCHMPRVVYGLRAAHRSHRIDSPRPSTSDRLDACGLCHLDGSHLRGAFAHAAGSERGTGLEDLFAGDPIQRSVVAAALGRPETASPAREQRMALLLEVMRDDTYPGVRSVAWTSLRALAPLETPYVPTDTRASRLAAVTALARQLSITPALPDEHATLRARASTRAIEIGE